MRNDLLADIVTASGGTITDRNNRNLLLKDWLDAVKAPAVNYVARLNGTDQYWQLSEAISIGSSNFALRLKVTTSFSGSQVHLTDSPEDFYFKIFIAPDGIPSVLFGDGSQWVYSLNAATNIADSKEHSIEVVKNSGQLYLLVDGVIEFQRDELTQVLAGIEFIGVRNSLSQYFNGSVYDFEVEINNTLTHSIPLTNKAQGAYQVATTEPLGENLYTQEIIENPLFYMNQWSYLGGGRWQLNGNGDANTIQFLSGFDQPESGYVQFEIESISTGGITCTQVTEDGSVFSTVGVKTFFYSSKADIQSIQFKRSSGAVQAVIKDIKHYDADGVLVAAMAGYNEDVWEQV